MTISWAPWLDTRVPGFFNNPGTATSLSILTTIESAYSVDTTGFDLSHFIECERRA
jgi:hypothetical protein